MLPIDPCIYYLELVYGMNVDDQYCQLLGGGGSIGVGHVWGGHYVYEWGRGGGVYGRGQSITQQRVSNQ